MTEITESNNHPCSACQAGHMLPVRITYFTWLVDELITVPNFPAWVCDVCGRREYDQHAVNEISLLLAPHAGKANGKTPRPKPAAGHFKNTRTTTHDQQ
ncbi:MAG: YgiT-type zinc finger protein [Anaerolineaceae bacterium]